MTAHPLVNPPPTSPATSKAMKGNAGKNTRPELELRRLLRAAGWRGYRLHWRVPGSPDIAYPGRRVAVQVLGDWWHRCPICNPPMPKSNTEFWAEKFRRNTERDERKTRELEALGWTVVTVWECEIRDHPDEVVRRIEEILSART